MLIRTLAIPVLGLLVALGARGETVTSPDYDLTGSLKDVFDDPTNPEHIFLYLQSSNDVHYVAIGCTNRDTRAAPADPFDVPPASTLLHTHPDDLSQQGFRRVRGEVLAAWDDTFVLVRSDRGKVVDAELRLGELPKPGMTVDLVGLPETTLYNLQLNRAIWRPTDKTTETNDAPVAISAERIVADKLGRSRMDIKLHGRTLRVKGIVRSLPKAESVHGLLYLEDDGFIVPVNADAAASTMSELQIGCVVEATGVCVMDKRKGVAVERTCQARKRSSRNQMSTISSAMERTP